MRRAFWTLFGIGVMRWTRRTAERLTPGSVSKRAFDLARDWRERLGDALEEGRAAMAEREAELRAQLAEPGDEAR